MNIPEDQVIVEFRRWLEDTWYEGWIVKDFRRGYIYAQVANKRNDQIINENAYAQVCAIAQTIEVPS